MTRTCSTCPAQIGRRSRTGRCAACANADPAVRAAKGKLSPEQRARRAEHARTLSADRTIVARRAAAAAETHTDPAVKARHRAACRRGAAARMADPVKLARLREIGRLYGSQNMASTRTPEARAKVAAAIQAAHLAWCPADLWPFNQQLKRSGKRLPERKQIICDIVRTRQLKVLDADAAADFLARFAPTYRCDERGRPCRASGYWRYGTAVLTRDALLERAGRRGWPPAADILTTTGATT